MKNNFFKYCTFLVLLIATVSCEKYLEKTPDSNVTDEQVFGSYRTFQGFVDNLYGDGLIVYHVQAYTSSFDFGDDVDCNKDFPSGYAIPRGNYLWWTSNLDHNPFVTTDKSAHNGLWDRAWVNIRMCNQGLESLNQLANNSQEEYNRLKGQMLFFRAWNHFEVAKYWGGLPYIDKAFSPDDDMKLPRLSFKATLLRVADDLTEAAALLPTQWDENTTMGPNTGRITKGAALALKSRALLYAASPLATKMETGSATTASYDVELCKQAAAAAYEVIKLANGGTYQLVPWSDYSYMFADARSPKAAIYTRETIFAKIKPASAVGGGQVTNFGVGRLHNSGRFGGNSVVTCPTVNFVDLYETSTGYAIKDAPAGDYNTLVPWAKRDPRLWKTILVDGVKWVAKNNNADAYIQLYTNVGGSTTVGRDRKDGNVQSLSGYLIRKYIPYKVNNVDAGAEWNNFRFNCPYIRLAEMYLNFAEAANEAYGPMVAPTDFDANGLTAVEAINTVRRRVKLPTAEDLTVAEQVYGTQSLPDVLPQYTGSTDVFRERIRNERSVELAFEGHRFIDLRRWYLSHLPEYKTRYGINFNKEHTVCQKFVLFEGQFDENKHYWFPFRMKDVEQYAAFQQNPGW